MEKEKLDELSEENVSGGVDPSKSVVRKRMGIMEHLKRKCTRCGKEYYVPDAILPEAYGDFSMCSACNKDSGLRLFAKNEMGQDELMKVSGGQAQLGMSPMVTETYICKKCGKSFSRSHVQGSCWMFRDATTYCDNCWHEVHDSDGKNI